MFGEGGRVLVPGRAIENDVMPPDVLESLEHGALTDPPPWFPPF